MSTHLIYDANHIAFLKCFPSMGNGSEQTILVKNRTDDFNTSPTVRSAYLGERNEAIISNHETTQSAI